MRRWSRLGLPIVFTGIFTLALAVLACPLSAVAADPGFLGLEIQGIDERIAGLLGPDYAKGIMVKDVAVGEPGALAGFRRGDFIVEFAGSKVATFDDLLKLIAKTKPDDKIAVIVLRAGKKTELTLRLTARPAAWNNMTAIYNDYPELGLKVVTVNEDARKQFGFPWGTIGVVVQEVDPKGPVAGGLTAGEVIISANLNDIWEPRQLTRQIEEARKQGRSGVLLLVRSNAGYRYAILPVK